MAGGTNLDRLHAAVDHWNHGDLEAYLELYDDDISLHGYSPEAMSKAEVRGFYSIVFEAFPGSQLSIEEEIADGDRLALRFVQKGTHTGPFMGLGATGREFAMSGQTVLHFRDGRVVERWSSADMLGLLVQLGAVPAPS